MKKYIKGIISLIILFVIILLLVFLTIKQYKDDHIEPDLGDFGVSTFEFTGDSEHYNFSTGKVFFNTGELESKFSKKVLITDFEQTNIIDGLTREKITIYFGGNVWKKKTRKIGLNKLHETIEDYNFYEEDLINYSNTKKSKTTSFDLTNRDNFQNIIRVEAEFCTVEDGCEVEIFKLKFKNP